MNLEQQVTSLELSEKLKELGVPQESLFYWARWRLDQDYKPVIESDCDIATGEKYSAFTVAELGNFLSEASEDVLQRAYNEVFGVRSSRFITTTGMKMAMKDPSIGARMLIYLLENNL